MSFRKTSHGWVLHGCRMCYFAGQHAKWHEFASGEVINPIVLVQWLERAQFDSVEDFRNAAINYVTFITTLNVAALRADGTFAPAPVSVITKDDPS